MLMLIQKRLIKHCGVMRYEDAKVFHNEREKYIDSFDDELGD